MLPTCSSLFPLLPSPSLLCWAVSRRLDGMPGRVQAGRLLGDRRRLSGWGGAGRLQVAGVGAGAFSASASLPLSVRPLLLAVSLSLWACCCPCPCWAGAAGAGLSSVAVPLLGHCGKLGAALWGDAGRQIRQAGTWQNTQIQGCIFGYFSPLKIS